jgi:hypothetical protein
MKPTHSISEYFGRRPPSLAGRLTTVRQMLATLDTVTIASQRHLMTKVLAFVDGQVERAIKHAGAGNRGMLLDQLALLRRESDRQLPSVPAFGERAESSVALLTIGAQRPGERSSRPAS